MTSQPEPELGEGIDPNAEIDLADARIAWNFGTRELTEAEYEHFAALHHADYARWAAAEAADEAWRKAQAEPEAAAQAEAEFHAESRARSPLLYGEATPEMEQVVHEAGGWFGYEADRATEPEPEPVAEAAAEAQASLEVELGPELEI